MVRGVGVAAERVEGSAEAEAECRGGEGGKGKGVAGVVGGCRGVEESSGGDEAN